MEIELERREMPAQGLEVRAAANGAPLITGYAVVFNAWSRPLYDYAGRQFVERFDPGAFDGWLSNAPELVALWNHNADMPLARLSRGTLRIERDSVGLYFEMQPPDNSWGADALVAIRRGDVAGMSFLFEAARDAWSPPQTPDGLAMRTVLESVLHEISPVTFPAYPATNVRVRSVRVPDFIDESDSRAAAEIDRQNREQWRLRLEARRQRLALYGR